MLFSILSVSWMLLGTVVAVPNLVRRDGGPLYSGQPTRFDVGVAMPNSLAVQACLAAVVHVAPEWISSRITVTEGSDGEVRTVSVKVYNYADYAETTGVAHWADTANGTGDYRGWNWWPGAYDSALASAGVDILAGLYPGTVLSAMTGIPSQTSYFPGSECADADCLFDILGTSQSNKSPMVFSTYGNATTLEWAHALAVVNTSSEGGTRMVGSYDPWTAGDRYDSFDTIYPEIEQVIHLEASIRSLERSIGEQRRRSGN